MDAITNQPLDSKRSYVVLHGSLPHTDKELIDYVAHIVYGNPRVEAVEVGKNFVAILEYGEAQATNAKYTFERMGSFSIGATLALDIDVALREFGVWVRYNAPGIVVGVEVA